MDECTTHGDGFKSDTSSGSYASGIDADYYDMKEQHKERKRHFRELQKAKPEFGPAEEDDAANEIKDAIAKAQRKKKLEPLDLLGGKDFELYSLDHIKHCPDNSALTRYIDFYADESFDYNAPLKERPNHYKHPYGYTLDLRGGPVHTPKVSSPRWKFSSFDDHDVTVKISAELVFAHAGKPKPDDAPNVFKYYGVCPESKKAEERWKREQESRSSASPE
ncbi:hypothetical protein NW766_012135 [Fusarium irregulare]|uniref:Uncharacterized protein n=1 Tax=Fusarium irregulare TaxID=2494466 RepID=A0A9W8PE22_9HYPO|nr:hypothetical protein NW766_012135 [Fusarium irregulare]